MIPLTKNKNRSDEKLSVLLGRYLHSKYLKLDIAPIFVSYGILIIYLRENYLKINLAAASAQFSPSIAAETIPPA